MWTKHKKPRYLLCLCIDALKAFGAGDSMFLARKDQGREAQTLALLGKKKGMVSSKRVLAFEGAPRSVYRSFVCDPITTA